MHANCSRGPGKANDRCDLVRAALAARGLGRGAALEGREMELRVCCVWWPLGDSRNSMCDFVSVAAAAAAAVRLRVKVKPRPTNTHTNARMCVWQIQRTAASVAT